MKQSRSILLALAAAAAVSAAPVARAQTKLVYGNVTSVTLSQGVIVAAKALGFFKEEGIDVEIVEFNGTGTLLPQMTAKRVQVGYPNPDVLMISRQPGKDPLPIKYFYNATRESAWEFIVPADSPIRDLKDLKGKKIGVGALSFGNIPITKAMFKELGFEAELLPVGVGAPAFLAFREKRVDALNLFDSQHATLEVQGTAIRRLAMPKKYKDLFSNGFVAHEDMIRDDPKSLIAFGRAIAKTSVFCEVNRAACVKAFWTLYPNQKPTSGDEATNIRNAIKIMDARFNKYLDFDDQKKRRWGEFPAQAWKDFAATLYEGGQLSTKDIPVETCYTNALVPEMNRFDSAAIVARARAAQ
ncbi:MAG: ABC transporter substrate-binding protein [Proteobacteria bacterium]|nr:ABC transporter substrate-binding protein [Pseudomonadota bacterium]